MPFRARRAARSASARASATDSRLNPGDTYENKARYAVARWADAAEDDWRDISDEVLADNPAVLSFLDDAGFKFVLPAVTRYPTRTRWRSSRGGKSSRPDRPPLKYFLTIHL